MWSKFTDWFSPPHEPCDVKRWIGGGVKGTRSDLFYGTIPVFVWWNWAKQRKMWRIKLAFESLIRLVWKKQTAVQSQSNGVSTLLCDGQLTWKFCSRIVCTLFHIGSLDRALVKLEFCQTRRVGNGSPNESTAIFIVTSVYKDSKTEHISIVIGSVASLIHIQP